jgi:hypothetical protein
VYATLCFLCALVPKDKATALCSKEQAKRLL